MAYLRPFNEGSLLLFCLFNYPTEKNRWFLWWSAWFNHGVGPSSRQKMWSDRRKLWRAWKHGLLVEILVTNPHVFESIPANTWLNTNYDIIVTSKYQQQLTKHATTGFCIYIYIYPGCNLAAEIVDVVVSSPTLKNKNAKKKRTCSWTTTLPVI